MKNLNPHYKMIIESLKLLSISDTDNNLKELFPKYVDLPFEVADTFFNSFVLLPQLIEEKYFVFEDIANLLRLNNFINAALNRPDIQNISDKDFFEDEFWSKVVNMSKKILSNLGIAFGNPDRNFL